VWEPAPFREPRPLHAVHAPVAEPEAQPEHEHELTELRAAETVPETSPLRAQSAAAKPSPMRARIAARAPSAVAPADLVGDWDELERKPARAKAALPAPEPPPEVDMGTANFSDDHYGDTHENLRIPAGIAGANALFWLVGRMFGVVELVGVAFFVAIGLLLAAYVMREWQRDRTALICIAGALPLPLTIISLFV
jgi:hypothetical protein